MPAKIKLKRGSTTSWADSTKDNKLSYGQPGIETRNGKAPRLKIGNQASDTAWASLPYAAPDPEIYRDDEINFDGLNIVPITDGFKINITSHQNALMYCYSVNTGSSEYDELRFYSDDRAPLTLGLNEQGIACPISEIYSRKVFLLPGDGTYRVPVVRYGNTLPTDFTGHITGDIFYLLQE